MWFVGGFFVVNRRDLGRFTGKRKEKAVIWSLGDVRR